MVSFKIAYSDVVNQLNLPQDISIEDLDHLFSFAKCEIEEHDLEDDYLKVDCKTSNRPDVWSCEGLVREVSGITGLNVGLPDLSSEPSGFVIEVDPSIESIRPYIACSIVRGIKFSDFLIKQLIQLQEKIDYSYGRRRKRSSIGIYNVGMLESPIYYGLTPRSDSFVPLGYLEKMTLDEIMEKHEKGIEYGHILPSEGDLPILRDRNGLVLSMPPIINSNDVGRVTEETTDVLIEVTGTNLEVVRVVTLIVTQALRDRGGKVYSVEVRYPENHVSPPILITPDSELKTMEVNPTEVKRYLDLDISKNEIIKLLKQRRLDVISKKGTKNLVVKYPIYRQDLLHWVDIAEETAIAYGYMKFEPTDLKFTTVGRLSPRTMSEKYVREILSSCALQEILTFTLTAPEKLSTLMRHDVTELTSCVEVANPVSSSYSILRHRILPGMLDFLSQNTHNEYAQNLFEVGEIVTRTDKTIQTISRAAVTLADAEEASFERCHSILETLITRLGIKYELKPVESSEFIKGRTAQILINEKDAGIIGEISPDILERWELFIPVAAFEIDLSLIPNLDLPPLLTYDP